MKSIKTKLIVSIGLMIIILSLVFLYMGYKNTTRVISLSEKKELTNLYKTFLNEIKAKADMATVMAEEVALIPDVQEAFAKGDREKLKEMFIPVFKKLSDEGWIKQFQFHKPPAISFLRVHKPKKFGDDLSSFRFTVVKCNKEKVPVSGLEKGVAGFGIRGVVPVFYQGQHIGSVEFGISFGDSFVERLKKSYGVDYEVFIEEDGNYKVLASTIKEAYRGDKIKDVLDNGKLSTVYTTLDGIPYAVIIGPVRDFSGKVVGVVEILKDRREVLGIMRSNLIVQIGTGIALLIIILILLYFITNSITVPLIKVTNLMDKFSKDFQEGKADLTERIEIKRNDETGILAGSLNRLLDGIKDILKQLKNESVELLKASSDVHNASEKLNDISQSLASTSEETAATVEEVSSSVEEVARNAKNISGYTEKIVGEVDDTTKINKDMTEKSKMVIDNSSLITGAMEQLEEMIDKTMEIITQAKEKGEEVKALANEGGQGIENTVEGMSTINKRMDEIGKIIDKLGKSSEEIGKITEVISDIADQTNLLALNAAIEAARAGDAGKGFAVVADEVRKLAERSQQAAGEINNLIKGIQTEIKTAISASLKGVKESESGMELAKQAGNMFNQIQDGIEEISSIVDLVYKNMSQEKESEVVLHDKIVENGEYIKEIGELIEEGQERMELIDNEIKEINNRLSEISMATDEQAAGIDELRKSVENVANMAQENADITRELGEDSAHIKELAEGLDDMVKGFKAE